MILEWLGWSLISWTVWRIGLPLLHVVLAIAIFGLFRLIHWMNE